MAADSSSSWCLIESDPAVFTDLCERFGANEVEVSELYATDIDSFQQWQATIAGEIYGFIFLFKWQKEMIDDRPICDPSLHKLFFAKQVQRNACATQALLSVLLNHESIQMGNALVNLKEFTRDFDPYMKGLAISESRDIQEAHNSFRVISSFEIVDEDIPGAKEEDAFHYLAYVPREGRLFELDGLKEGPVDLGEISPSTSWIEMARRQIETRIQRVQEVTEKSAEGKRDCRPDEIRFNLLAITSHQGRVAERNLKQKRYLLQAVKVALLSHGEDVDMDDTLSTNDDSEVVDATEIDKLPSNVEDLKNMLQSLTREVLALQETVSENQIREKRWKKENTLRRHDFVPFVLCVLRNLARLKVLHSALADAKDRVAGRASTAS